MSVGLLLSAGGTGAADTATRILVMPFTLNAGQDLAFLQRGISDMLVSRLELASKVIVIAAGQPGDDIVALAQQNRRTLWLPAA